MNWIVLKEEEQLAEIKTESSNRPVVIFKHSTRCSISLMAKSRLDRESAPDQVSFYYLDLLKYRPLSNRVAEEFGVQHASPQVLLIKDGKCVYDESHNGIEMSEIGTQIRHVFH